MVAYCMDLQQNPTMAPVNPNLPQPDPFFESTYAALIGAGMSKWSSLGELYTTWPSETVDLGHRLLCEGEDAATIGYALAEIGSKCPAAAQAVFSIYIAQNQFKDLILPNAGWLTSLPPILVVPDYFYLDGCSAPSFLPMVMRVGGAFVMFGCPNIRKLPNDLTIGNDLWIDDCDNLIALPEALKLNGELEIAGCNALKEVPAGLTVNGDMWVCGCSSLQSLPIGLHVSKALSVRSCSSWDGLIPASASIGGLICTDAYPDGLSLIEWRLVPQP